MKTIASKTIKIVEWVVFLSLILLLFLLGSSLLPTKSLLSTYVVSTGSMEPEIMAGSLVLVTQSEKYGLNDVVVFPSPNNTKQTIVHRIDDVETSSGGNIFVTKGDNNDSQDNWTLFESEVIGSVFLTIPFLGRAINAMKTPVGFGLLLAVPLILFIILQFRKIREGIEEEVQKRTAIEVEKVKESMASENVSESKLESVEIDLPGAPIEEVRNDHEIDQERLAIISQMMNKYGGVFAILVALTATIFISSPSVYALFTSEATVTGLSISTREAFMWTGGLEVINKTTGANLNIDPHLAESDVHQNIVFRPISMTPDSNHFTMIIKDMQLDSMIHFRTMLTRWTMDNFRQDGHLGYTFWKTGNYWLQINAYRADGSSSGYYYAILNIYEPVIPAAILHAPAQLTIIPDQEVEEEEEINTSEEGEVEDEPNEIPVEQSKDLPIDDSTESIEEALDEALEPITENELE